MRENILLLLTASVISFNPTYLPPCLEQDHRTQRSVEGELHLMTEDWLMWG